MASSVAKNVSKKTTLPSSNGEVFEASVESQTSEHLSKAAFSDKSEENPSDADDFLNFDKLEQAKLLERARAAHEQNMMNGNTKSVVELAREITGGKMWKMNYLPAMYFQVPLDQDPCFLAAQKVDEMKKTPGWIPIKHLSKDAFSDKSEDKPSDADEKGFHFDFDKMDPAKLFKLARAANKENMMNGNTKSMVEMACEITADTNGTTPEEVLKKFNAKMGHYLASHSPLDQDPCELTLTCHCQAKADKKKGKTPGRIPKKAKNKNPKAANKQNTMSGNTKSPLEAACEIIADMEGKTPEEIRKTFFIKNDFTPEAEEILVRKHDCALKLGN